MVFFIAKQMGQFSVDIPIFVDKKIIEIGGECGVGRKSHRSPRLKLNATNHRIL